MTCTQSSMQQYINSHIRDCLNLFKIDSAWKLPSFLKCLLYVAWTYLVSVPYFVPYCGLPFTELLVRAPFFFVKLEMDINLSPITWRKRNIWVTGHRWKDNIKVDIREQRMGSIFVHVRDSFLFVWTRYWTFLFTDRREISWPAERPTAVCLGFDK